MTQNTTARNRIEWILLGVTLLIPGALLGYSVFAEHREIEALEADRLQVQARVIDENLGRQLEGVNNALAGVRDDLLQWNGETMSVGPSRRLRVLSEVMLGVRTLHIANAEGTVLDSNQRELIGRNFSEREYFKAPRERPDPGMLYVSPPYTTQLGVFSINLTRVLTNSSGKFAGVVSATMDSEYFNVLLRSVLYAPDMRAVVAHGDGRAFVVVPAQQPLVGADMATPGSFFSRHRDSGRTATLLTSTSVSTGDERMMASRTLKRTGLPMDKPLVIHVSRNLSALYLSWRAHSLAYGMFFGLFAASACLGLHLLQRRRQLMVRIEAIQEKERRENAERLELALAGADMGLWDHHLPTGNVTFDARWSSLLGYAKSEIKSHISAWEELVHPKDLASARAAVDSHLRGKTLVYETEHRLRHKDGRWVWILARGKVVERDAAGAPLRMVGTHMDITERKRVEAEREQYFRFFELSLDPMCIADPVGSFKQVNPAFVRLTGFSEAELLSRPFMEFVLPEDRQRTADVMKQQVTHRPSLHFENRYVCKDGRVIPLTWTAFYDRSDGVTYATARDLSEQRRKEAEYHTVIQASIDGFWITDFTGRILEVNAAICQMLGYSGDELLRMSVADIEAEQSRDEIAQRIGQMIPAGSAQFPGRHRRKDGRVIDVEVSALCVPALGERFFVFVRDVTKRKQAETALVQSEQRLRAIVETEPECVKVVGRDGQVLEMNAAGLAMLEAQSVDEVQRHTLLGFVLPEYRAAFGALHERVMRGESGMLEFEVVGLKGTRRWLDTHAAPMRDAAGEVSSFLGISRDITERKKAEQAHAFMEAQLRESQKMEALGTLAGGVAHDFNNIIAAIMGNVELARQDVGPVHAAMESLEEIRRASRRAKELVQQILAFGRRQKAVRRVMSLAPVVEESMRLLRTTLPAGVSLTAQCEPDAPAVSADATQIEQVLLNLCSNAWQAIRSQSRPGAIEVLLQTCECEAVPAPDTRPAMGYGDRPAGRCACLTVRDNGPGMDKETLARIFEPFFTTKPVNQGTGLGLAVVHGIVQEHGGSIDVQSVPGAGSTFRVYLPAAAAPEPALATHTPVVAPTHGQGKRVLFVDDDESIVFLMTRLLERQGYRVSGYTDPRAALAAVRANPPQFDLAVTDYNMPGMSGLDVARALHEIRADLPVALASGYITDELRAQAPAAGICELIYKPNTVDELCQAIARLATTLPV